jgi:release factor glutamine methyltransferase
MDWASALTPESFDVVVGNPPYIGVEEFPMLDRAVSAFDPHSALDGGSGGLEAFRALVPQAARCLKPGGFIILETGRDQAAKVADLMAGCGSNPGFVRLRIITDLAGMTRAVAGLRQF